MPGVMQRNGHVDGYAYSDRDRAAYVNYDYERSQTRGYSSPDYDRPPPRGYADYDRPPQRHGYEDERDSDPYRMREDPYSRRMDPYKPSHDNYRRDEPYRTPMPEEPAPPSRRVDEPYGGPNHPPQRMEPSQHAAPYSIQNINPLPPQVPERYERSPPHISEDPGRKVPPQVPRKPDPYRRALIQEIGDLQKRIPGSQPAMMNPEAEFQQRPEEEYQNFHSLYSNTDQTVARPAERPTSRRIEERQTDAPQAAKLHHPSLVDIYQNRSAYPVRSYLTEKKPNSPSEELKEDYSTIYSNSRQDPSAYRDPNDLYSHVHKGYVTNGNNHAPQPRSGDHMPGDLDGAGHRERHFNGPYYELDHLASFTVSHAHGLLFPEQGIRRLRQMEGTSGIWTMRCYLVVERNHVLIINKQEGDEIERFPLMLLRDPTAVTNQDRRDIYNNILLFTVLEDPDKQSDHSEMHFFQCLSRPAAEAVDDIKSAKEGRLKIPQGLPRQRDTEQMSPGMESSMSDLPRSVVPDRVREYEMAAQQAALATAKYQPGPPPGRAFRQSLHHDDNESMLSERTERDVQLLNHCIDDIEKFVSLLQHAADNFRELQRRKESRSNKKNKKKHGEGMLTIRARAPPAKEFIDVFQKFKMSFNLLAKLRAVIHDPNAPELVHFLFTPLSLVVHASKDPRNDLPDLASKVVVPLLTADAKEMLTNCLSSKEYDLWTSLGETWTLSRDEYNGYVPPFFPRFTDGWQPTPSVIDDMAPIGPAAHLAAEVAEKARIKGEHRISQEENPHFPGRDDPARYEEMAYREDMVRREDPYSRGPPPGRMDEPPIASRRVPEDVRRPDESPYGNRFPPPEQERYVRDEPYSSRLPAARQTEPLPGPPPGPPAPLSFEEEQRLFTRELRAKNAKIYVVSHERAGKNHKELTVKRAEILEVLDDTRNWWKLRNHKGEVGHVPYTILQQYEENQQEDWPDGGFRENEKFNRYEASHDRHVGGSNPQGAHGDVPSAPVPPPPPPVPQSPLFNKKQQNSKKGPLSPGLRRTSTKEEHRRSQQDILNDELKLRVTQGKGRDFSRRKATSLYITESSSPAEVREWLVSKGFSERVLLSVDDKTGADLFALKRAQLEAMCGHDEASRLDSQLTVQKNIAGYKTLSTAELTAILQKRKERADESEAQLGSPPNFAPDSPNDSGLNSEVSAQKS